ncbi:hypothetical protein M378DRAFT_203886 [Amanita muscaria Koide BX008]|uniref:Uncharacterized protein n=1 Tax=Amanita muscaria (strain Koide BX008) TaxID=946122 RepID=A0A0C2XPP7_AMAMK|nr:hypothetical protein M378DRAFT_203886 [Amanita muscaria Koide BX008]
MGHRIGEITKINDVMITLSTKGIVVRTRWYPLCTCCIVASCKPRRPSFLSLPRSRRPQTRTVPLVLWVRYESCQLRVQATKRYPSIAMS